MCPTGAHAVGEGIADCLVREFAEELDLAIRVAEHIYTTDFYQPSAFDNSQLISVYYRVDAPDPLVFREHFTDPDNGLVSHYRWAALDGLLHDDCFSCVGYISGHRSAADRYPSVHRMVDP